MKKYLLWVMVISLFLPLTVFAQTVEVSLENTEAVLGENVDVEVNITDVDLSLAQLTIVYDSTMLSFNDFTSDYVNVGDLSLLPSDSIVNGKIIKIFDDVFVAPNVSGEYISFNFTALAVGTAELAFVGDNMLFDPLYDQITDITFTDGSVEIAEESPVYSVYDVQYTDVPGAENTYPSLMVGQEITVKGIVTYVEPQDKSERFYISDAAGGPWTGVLVYNGGTLISPSVGDEIEITGSVVEYNGMTEISDVVSHTIVSTGNAVPDAAELTTNDLATDEKSNAVAEQYEGSYVQVSDVIVTSVPNNYGEWYVSDGSGACQVDDSFFAPETVGENYVYSAIKGFINYSYGEYELLPTAADDINEAVIGWCNLQYPASITVDEGEATEDIFGQIYVENFTGLGADLSALTVELGYGPDASDPSVSTEWTWTEAAYNDAHTGDDNNEYKAALTVAIAGTYDYCYRYQLNGQDWIYGDLNGSNDDYQVENAGNLVVEEAISMDPPTGLTASTDNTSGIQLNWVNPDNDAFTGIKVYRAEVTGGPYTELTEVTSTSHLDDTAAEDTPYFYVLTAVYPDGESAYSTEAEGLRPAEQSYLTVYDIQYTDVPGDDNTYPSPYFEQEVTVRGVVTYIEPGKSQKFYISDAVGGPWTGVYVYNTGDPVTAVIGDEVEFTTEVQEYYGMTELFGASNFSVLQSGVDVPAAVELTTDELATYVKSNADAEPYEGSLVKVSNVTVTQAPDGNGQWFVDDGTGACQIDDGFFAPAETAVGYMYSSIMGFLNYSYNEYEVLPTTAADVVEAQIGWCNLQWPYSIEIDAGNTTETIYGQVWVENFTGQGSDLEGLTVELGYGPDGSDPAVSTEWTWIDPAMNTEHTGDNNNEYMGAFTVSEAGTYDYCFRYKVNNQDWVFGDENGSNDGYQIENAGDLVVNEGVTLYPPENLTASDDNTAGIEVSWDEPTIPFTGIQEGFEDGTWPPEGWMVKYSTDLAGTDLQDPTDATWFHNDASSFGGNGAGYIHSGDYSAAIGYTAPDFNWLITPEVNIEQDTELSFWYWYYNSVDDGWITKFYIYIDNGGTWELLKAYDETSPNNLFETMEVIDLSAYAGSNTKIAFVYEYNDGFQMAIDDLAIGQYGLKQQGNLVEHSAPIERHAMTKTDIANNIIDNSKLSVIGYNVYRSITSGPSYDLLYGDVSETYFMDETAEYDTEYYYVVTALYEDDYESVYSNQDMGYRPSAAVDPPTDLSASENNPNAIDLTWTAPGGGSGGEFVEEGFETGAIPGEWTVIDGQGTAGEGGNIHWHVTDGTAAEGTYSVASDWGYSIDEWLITPDMDFSSTSAPELTFYFNTSYYWSVEQGNCDLFVKVSTDGGSTWSSSMWTFADYGTFENFVWYEVNLDMSGYNGESSVQIAFNLVGDDNSANQVDAISVTDGTKILTGNPNYKPISNNIKVNEKAKSTDIFGNEYSVVYTNKEVTGYNIYRSETSGSGYSEIASNVADAYYSDTEAAVNTNYYYVVTAVYDNSNESGYSNEDMGYRPDSSLEPPTELQASNNNPNAIDLTWTAPGGGGGGGELVQESFESGSIPEEWTVIDSDNGTPGEAGDVHWHVNDATAAEGTYSVASDWGYSIDEWLITPAMDFSSASAPELTFYFNTSYYWSVEQGNCDLFVKVSTDGGNTWSSSLWTFADYGTFESFVWSEVNLDMSAYNGESSVQVAFNLVGDDNSSNAVDAISVTDGTKILAGNPNFTPISNNIKIDEKAKSTDVFGNEYSVVYTNKEVTGYNVYRSETSGTGYSEVASNVLGTSYSDAEAAVNTTYYYVVTAIYDGSDESIYSNEDDGFRPDEGLDAPTNLTATDDLYEAIELTWTAPGGGGGGGEEISEGFENAFPPEGWSQDGENSDVSGPIPATWNQNNYESADYTIHEGSYHVGLWWSYDHQDEWLITPEFEAGSASELSFWSVGFEGSVNADHYYVKVSTDGGSTWSEVFDLSTLTGGWNYYDTPYNVDLSEYAGQNIKIAFNAVDGPTNDGLWYIWFIDAVTVTSGDKIIRFNTEDFEHQSANPVTVNNTSSSNMLTRDPSTYVAGTPKETVTGYNVYRSETSGAGYAEIASNVSSTSYSDSEAAVNTEYYYVVTAIYDGTTESGYSNEDMGFRPEMTVNPPMNLAATNNIDTHIGLTWEEPEGLDIVVHYDGENANSIGTNGAVNFDVAARFTSEELGDYYGSHSINSVLIYVASGGGNAVTMKIWEGGSSGNPGTLVYEENISSELILDGWTEHTLTSPVALTSGNEYWVGYNIDATGGYPAGCDAGPSVSEKGSWMYFNGAWGELPDLGAGLDYNWNIRAVLGSAKDKAVVINNAVEETALPEKNKGTLFAVNSDGSKACPKASVSYYNLYRSLTSGSDYELLKENLTDLFYDDVDAEPETDYYYVATAVYDNDMESDYSNEAYGYKVAPIYNPPRNLQATEDDPEFIELTWQEPSQIPVLEGLVENFDNGLPEGWEIYNVNNSGMTWYLSSELGSPAPPCMYHEDGAIGETNDNWLVTPMVTVPADAPDLSFMSYTYFFSYYEKHSVHVSLGSPDPADGDYVEVAETPNSDGSIWEEINVDLSDYAGMDAYIAFRYEGTFADEWGIDAIILGAGKHILVKSTPNPNYTEPTNKEYVNREPKIYNEYEIKGVKWPVASYNIFKSNASGSGYTEIASDVSDLTYKDYDVEYGNEYYYVVTANFTDGEESEYSNEAHGFCPYPDWDEPTDLTATVNDPRFVHLEWTSPSSGGGGGGGTGGELVEESFEDGSIPEEWTVIDSDNGTPGEGGNVHWYVTDVTAADGMYSVASDWGYSIDEWLITPAMDFSEVSTPELTFYFNTSYYWSVEQGNCDLFVKVSTDEGETWSSSLWTFADYGTFENFVWSEVNLDLSDYAGEGSVQIALNLVGDDNSANQVDAISVTDGSKAVFGDINRKPINIIKKSIDSKAKTPIGYTYSTVTEKGQPDLTGFSLFRKLEDAEEYSKIVELDTETTEYDDITAEPGVKYMYMVQSDYEDGGHSVNSNEVLGMKYKVPGIHNLTLEDMSGVVVLDWDLIEDTNVVKYVVSRKSDYDWETIAELNRMQNFFMDGPGQGSFIYKVHAVGPFDYTGLESNEVSVYTTVSVHVMQSIALIRDEYTTEDGSISDEVYNEKIAVMGKVTAANYNADQGSGALGFDVYLEDETSGICLHGDQFPVPHNTKLGDVLMVIGYLRQYRGLTRIEFIETVTHMGSMPVNVTDVTLSELNDYEQVEELEGKLVKIEDVSIVNPGEWDNQANFWFDVSVKKGSQEFPVRVLATTDLYNLNNAPAGNFDLVGLVSQYDFDGEAPFNTGYMIIPRWRGDMGVEVPPLTMNIEGEMIEMVEFETMRFTATGGVPPYSWMIDEEEIGHFDSNIAGLFHADMPGEGIITVVDNWGASAEMPIKIYNWDEAYAAPSNLSASDQEYGDRVYVSWDAPSSGGGGGGGTGDEFTEGFEEAFPAEGWSLNSTNTDVSGPIPGTWTQTNYSSDDFSVYEGNYHIGFWWSYDHQDEWVISPEFTANSSTLSFWSAAYEGSTNADHYYVKVSTDGGTTWEEVFDLSAINTGQWNYYAYPYSIDLSEYDGETIQFAFQAVDGPTNDGMWYIWFIDNVQVSVDGKIIEFDSSDFALKSNSNNRVIVPENNLGSDNHSISRDGIDHAGIKRSVTDPLYYELYRGMNENNMTLYASNLEELEYNDMNVALNNTYYYGVKAIYPNNIVSEMSNIDTGEMLDVVPPAPEEAPGYAVNNGVVTLTWNAVEDINMAGYNVYRKNNIIDSDFEKVNTALITETSYQDQPGDGDWTYYVTAVDAAGQESDPSPEVSFFFGNLPPTLTATSGLDEQVKLKATPYGSGDTEVEFRYDDGVVVGQLGFGANPNAVMGGAHFRNAVIEEISWYLTSNSVHPEAVLYIFGLNESGLPDVNQLLHQSDPQTNVDDQWNTYILPEPVEAPNGFLVGVCTPGVFTSLGQDDGVDEPYVFQEGTQYGIADWTAGTNEWLDVGPAGFPGNFTIRAYGMDLGKVEYNVPQSTSLLASKEMTPEEIEKAKLDGMFLTGSKIKAVNTGIPEYYTQISNTTNSVFGEAVRRSTNKDDLLGFNIYKSENPEAVYPDDYELLIYIETNEAVEYYDENVVNDNEYYYVATAMYSTGETQPSAMVSATPHDGIAPEPVTDLSYTIDVETNSVTLSWVDPADEDLAGIDIYRDGTFLINVEPGIETYTDTDLDAGVYSYTLVAFDEVPNESDEVSVGNIIVGLDYLMYEDFEGTVPPAGWMNTGSGPGWVASTDYMYSGDQSIYHNDDAVDCDDWLITPAVTIESASTLKFWKMQKYTSWYVYFGVWISTESSDISDFVEVEQIPAHSETELWEEYELDLSSYIGETIYIALRYQGNYADEWYIDLWRVESASKELSSINSNIPTAFALNQNYPNPFNPTTTIEYDIAKHTSGELAVYNILGQKVKTLAQGSMEPGSYSIVWDGTDESGETVGSGVYFYKLHTEEKTMIKKMMLVK